MHFSVNRNTLGPPTLFTRTAFAAHRHSLTELTKSLTHVPERVDSAKNRLYLFLRGFWSAEIAAAVSARVKQEVKALKPGFSIVNDISQLKIGPPEAAVIVTECQEWLGAQGAGRVVRVVSADNPLARMQFKRTSQEVYDASVVTTVQEAEQMLGG